MQTQAHPRTSSDTAASELLRRARELQPVLRQRAAQAERLRRVPDETIDDFHRAGLFRALQPARAGGAELHPADFFDICAEIAQGCASSAWVLSNLAYHHQFLALWPDEAQQEVWGPSPDTLVGSSYIFARGTARQVDGGYELEGQWPFSSGIDPCGWCVLGAMASDAPGEPPRPRYFLLPREDYEVLDTWHVVGLRATGSKDVAVGKAFVPGYRSLSFDEVAAAQAPGLALHAAPLFRVTMQGVGGFVLLPVLLGAARAAANEYVERTRQRKTTVGARSQAELPGVQDRVAHVDALLDTAQLVARCSWCDAMDSLEHHPAIPGPLGARLRRDSAFCARLVTQAVDLVFAGTGGAGLQETDPIQRMWRDVHAGAAQFGLQWDVSGPAYGRVRLGLPSGMPGLGV